MDTLTHGIAGAALGRAGAGERSPARIATLAAAIAAMFPDIDAFFMPGHWFRLGETLDYLRYHRGITHSFVLAPLWALLLAGLFRLFTRRVSWGRLWAFALAGILSHILFDWITSYGTMFFSPLSWRRYSLDWVFILDPIFTGIPLLTLVLAALFRRRAGRSIAVAGSAALLAYIGFCAREHGRALAAARSLFPGASVAALPQPLSPFRWMLVGHQGDAEEVAYVDLSPEAPRQPAPAIAPPRSLGAALRAVSRAYAAPSAARVRLFPAHLADPEVSAARRFDDVRAWFAFARFPVAAVLPRAGGGADVTLTDVRFQGPWRAAAFEYRVRLSPSGRELASGFVRVFVTDTPKKMN